MVSVIRGMQNADDNAGNERSYPYHARCLQRAGSSALRTTFAHTGRVHGAGELRNRRERRAWAEGDKFNWVAYSSYGEEDYVRSQDLKAQLERLFADNEMCQDALANIYHNCDEMAHHVEYRFHTLGVELSDSPDGPDFCPACGWNTQYLKCSAGPGDHPSEACHYFCSNCDTDTGITTPCLRKITFNMQIKLDASLTSSPNIISAVCPMCATRSERY